MTQDVVKRMQLAGIGPQSQQESSPAWASSAAFTRADKLKVERPERHQGTYSVQKLLEWAFGIELASVEFDEFEWWSRQAVGNEYILEERGKLGGVKIDNSGGVSRPAHDAEIIADAVAWACHPSMAIIVADYARACRIPDYMDGLEPKCVPTGWKKNRHGWRAVSKIVGHDSVERKGRIVREPRRACPVTYAPSPSEIAKARRKYLDWWGALLSVRAVLVNADMICHSVSTVMPPKRPWEKSS